MTTPQVDITESTPENEMMVLLLSLLYANGGQITISYEDMDAFEDASENTQFLVSIRPDDDKEEMTIIASPLHKELMN